MQLLTAAQMRAIEQAAIESGNVTGLELMERAGRGVVEAIFDWRPELAKTSGRAVVLCGPGNNGGDGFVVARLLKEKGWAVDVYLYGDEAKLPPDAATNASRWRELGEIQPWSTIASKKWRRLPKIDALVDAVFGVGLSRALPVEVAEVFDRMCASVDLSSRIAVDVPSGLCADSGRPLITASGDGAVFDAGCCVTFHAEKPAHRLAQGVLRVVSLRVVDIGLGAYSHPRRAAGAERRARLRLYDRRRGDWNPIDDDLSDVRKRSWAPRGGDPNKYTHGHALILSGGVGKGGAARLAARGALRIGAGLVTLGAPSAAIIENAARLDAVMLARIGDAEALAEALDDERINAVALGPGLGVGARARDLTLAALAKRKGRGVVLDADALTSFQEEPEALFDALQERSAVLTPHLGEFGRLFPDLKARLDAPATRGPAFSKTDAAREAAARAGCVVLLKGPDTVVADAVGGASVVSAQYERACPWLATAGAGDVLTGMIAGLLARRYAPKSAAEAAAWLHQEAALNFGPGLIAEDLPEALPRVFDKLRGE